MTAAPTAAAQIVVLRGSANPTDPAARAFGHAARQLAPAGAAEDPSAAAELLAADEGSPTDNLVVIGPDVERPLSAAGELRRMVPGVDLLFVVAEADVDAVEIRLGLVPELRGATVVPMGEPDQLAGALRDAARAILRRREVRGALDAMNRQMLRRREEEASPGRQGISESYLAALIRHVPEAIVSVDGERCLVAINETATRMFGISTRGVEGATLEDLFPPESNPELHRRVVGALEGETTTGIELDVVPLAADPLVSAVTVATVRDHAERIVGAVMLARDVTEQRRTERRLQELQKAKSLATLAGGVAHDFNNLLVSVRGWAQLAAEDIDDTDFVTEALERIQESAERAADLARSMLVYGGRGSFTLAPIDVAEVTREVAHLLHSTVSRKIDLELDVPDTLPAVEADVTQLRQVVMNLITNAAESIGDDEGRITVYAGVVDRLDPALAEGAVGAARHIVLAVSDTGPGMEESTRQRVFEPFFTTKFEGRGLGLAASRGIVRAHGGTLVADSAPGRGATFRMALPVSSTDAS